MTRFLVVLTDVRLLDGASRNERTTPERRRQVVGASNREAADRIAGAFMALGMVRAGRQRVKVLAVGRRLAGEPGRVVLDRASERTC
ncbi:hypothetical protein E1091_04805 [Micromonospora fluostatini]|uniref:DUF167 domain-containing protein n=1 Tax=Micromonospora fluostatini TaxID=1629071 RepID=A0ABY2DM56_9ACTN|nr:hypothetical protein E1091_04805 [Micromonospora fluostatini]